jgi:hypothetical protein
MVSVHIRSMVEIGKIYSKIIIKLGTNITLYYYSNMFRCALMRGFFDMYIFQSAALPLVLKTELHNGIKLLKLQLCNDEYLSCACTCYILKNQDANIQNLIGSPRRIDVHSLQPIQKCNSIAMRALAFENVGFLHFCQL